MGHQEESFNLVVIGGGAAGLVSANVAARVKARVALIEKKRMGGDCLYTGCVPSKALIKTAKVAALIRNHRQYGIKNADCEIDFSLVMERVRSAIQKIEPHDSVERYTELGVTCIQGEAQILDQFRVGVGGRILNTKNIILALGAEPLIPPIPGLMQVPFRTSENLWEMESLPKRLIILGGGPIGCEMAQAFTRLGSRVTQLEMRSRLLQREDREVALMVQKRLKDEGVRVITEARPTRIFTEKGSIGMTFERPGKSPEIIYGDEILVAVGRRPRTGGVDWSKFGIKLNPNGSFIADEYLRVNGDNIYACGDVVGPYQLTHAASHQAWHCAVNALFSPLKKFKVDYRTIPQVTFTDPEVASVGLSEIAAKAANIPYELTSYDLSKLDRAIAESDSYGFVRVLTARGKDRILGASIVAPRAGEMITEFIAAMKFGLGLNKIIDTIHPYPTFSEANKFSALEWKKDHAPEKIMEFLLKFNNLRRP